MIEAEQPIRVWDWPVRVFHWSLAACVFIAFFTGESERFSLWHQTLGYVAGGLLAFRLVWGFVGTRHARFASFIKGPQAILAYLFSLRQTTPEHHVGHNPAGGVAVLLLMGLTALTAFSGWLMAGGDAPGWQEELHEVAANSLMLVVAVHVLGVVLSSKQHKENLVRAMLTGFKSGPSAMGIQSSWWWLGLLMLVVMAGFIWQQLRV
jgi:cytochrome b